VAQLSFTTSTKPALLSGKPALDAEADRHDQVLVGVVRLSG
jgi:DNA polymerase-3 subunit beta